MTAERAVMLAIQAAGRMDDEWESRVAQAVPMVAGLLREQSEAHKVAQQVLDAAIIFGEYRGKHLEESSQRIIVTFMADNGDAPEEMRTHRIDEPAGKAMMMRLMGLVEGERCAFFKYVDTIGPKAKSRLLVNFERQPAKNARAKPQPPRQRGTGAERPAAVEAHRPAAETPAPNPSKAAVIRGLLAELNEEKRLKSIALLKEMGWEAADDIPDGTDFERAMYICRHQNKDYF